WRWPRNRRPGGAGLFRIEATVRPVACAGEARQWRVGTFLQAPECRSGEMTVLPRRTRDHARGRDRSTKGNAAGLPGTVLGARVLCRAGDGPWDCWGDWPGRFVRRRMRLWGW